MIPAKRVTTHCEHHATQTKRTKTCKDNQGMHSIVSVKSEDVTESIYDGIVLKNRTALSPKDLPPECLHGFRMAFRPAIRDFVGTLGPWESPADTDIVRIWNCCFPRHRLEASNNLFTTVSKLVDDTIQDWRHEMAVTAVQCLNMHLKSSFNKQHERVARATWLLGDDEKDRKRPFYYKKYGNGVKPSVSFISDKISNSNHGMLQGIFQSQVIATTLATHLSFISYLPEESRLPDYPTGALALSILAVKRALTWAKTGVEPIPKTPEGNFSRANWGDHYKLENGRYVVVKSASNIVSVIGKLQKRQWKQILAEARKFATERNKPTVPKALLGEETEDQSDFELEDWDDGQ
ncbi:hypothetical protein JVT61DRAFT_11694 [Boletus reticuloceps]|uniref:Uncharacterized protein n=1 Tax=Boletus reticuloceps TaxID=495285 RepID=A0A8I2YW57_9AGAM|nr:hypothetical protein JVT61DRAFT_11694 [Boletus reticuloceps]